jgi:hypothetical protein
MWCLPQVDWKDVKLGILWKVEAMCINFGIIGYKYKYVKEQYRINADYGKINSLCLCSCKTDQ